MTPRSQPDLILVMTDQQRYDQIGYAPGSIVRTPNLDALAAAGVTFTNAYSASTTCVPSRTALMTGLFDHRTHASAPLALPPGHWTMPHALRAVGYQTALIGKMHFDPIRSDHGFDHVRTCEHLWAFRQDPWDLDPLDHYHDWLTARGFADYRYESDDTRATGYPLPADTHPTAWVRDEALAFVEQRDPTRPMLLVVSFPHPHPPIDPPEPYASLYDPDACEVDPDGAAINATLPHSYRVELAQADDARRRVDPANLARHSAELARTYGLITQIDDAVGDLVARLDLSDALLFFTSDHGDYATRRGLVRKIPWIPFDDLAKVAFFATGGRVAGGRVEEAPMQAFDLATTFLAAAGVDIDLSGFDGIDLGPHLADPAATLAPDRVVFSAISARWPMARRGAHKYLRELGWGEEVLFDVVLDPEERWNVKHLDPGGKITADLSAAVDAQLAAGLVDLPGFPPHA